MGLVKKGRMFGLREDVLEHLHWSLYGLISISITLKFSTGFFIAIFIAIGLSMDQNFSKIEMTIEIVYSSYARVEFCIKFKI